MNRKHAIRNEMFQFLDSVAVFRLTLLFPVWTLVLLGYHSESTMPEAPTASQPLRLWTTLCLYTLLIGVVYIVNQITDRETDAVNNKLYLVARGYVKLKVLKWQIGFLMTLSILLSLLVFPRNLAYFTLIPLLIILGFAYSVCRLVISTVSTLICCNTTICPLEL